jgi:hypothetical protein
MTMSKKTRNNKWNIRAAHIRELIAPLLLGEEAFVYYMLPIVVRKDKPRLKLFMGALRATISAEVRKTQTAGKITIMRDGCMARISVKTIRYETRESLRKAFTNRSSAMPSTRPHDRAAIIECKIKIELKKEILALVEQQFAIYRK